MRPIIQICPGVGLRLVNRLGSESFQPLRVGHGDLHLQWQPVYQDVLRSVGPFAAFFPQAIFEGSGDTVTFSHCEGGLDILSKTRPLGPNESIADDEWERLDSGFTQFKAIGGRDGVPSDVRRFIEDFSYPSPINFPEAYRIYKPRWYSRRRLFLLWGLEPLGGASFVRRSPSEARAELASRVETPGGRAMSLLVKLLLALLAVALVGTAIWWAIFALLPAPLAAFRAPGAVEKQAVIFENLTTYDKVADFVDFGDVTYVWSFDRASPSVSNDENPTVIWDSYGNYSAELTVRRETIFGISKTSTAGPVKIHVKAAPEVGSDKTTNDVIDALAGNSAKGDGKPGVIAEDKHRDNPDAMPGAKDGENAGANGDDKSDAKRDDKPGDKGDDKPGAKIDDNPGAKSDNKPGAKMDPAPAPEPPRFPVGAASVVWFGSRAYGINQPQQWVTLGVEPPPGYKVTAVTVAGQRRVYTGKFEQLVKFGDSQVEIEVVKEDGTAPDRLNGVIRFNQPFEVLNTPEATPRKPSAPSGPSTHGEPADPERSVDPKKVPELSRGA